MGGMRRREKQEKRRSKAASTAGACRDSPSSSGLCAAPPLLRLRWLVVGELVTGLSSRGELSSLQI